MISTITEDIDTPEIHNSTDETQPSNVVAIPRAGIAHARGENRFCDGAFLTEPREQVAMVPEENSGRVWEREENVPHETATAPAPSIDLGEDSAPRLSKTAPSLALPDLPQKSGSENKSLRYAQKVSLWNAYQELALRGFSQLEAAEQLGVSNSTLSRMAKAVAREGLEGLKDKYDHCGRPAAMTLTPEEFQRIGALYLKTNRSEEAGSMQTACKFFAADPQTREEIRTVIFAALEKGRLPRFITSALKRISREHFAAVRQPGKLAANHFSGRRGTFAQDKLERRRIVESDDATLNFPAWIPWPHGGDPVSDAFGVRLGRWQFLPALEAGWSHFYLGYALVARPKSAYTAEDIRALIRTVILTYGCPDGFRFERGTWESDSVVDLLKKLGIDLTTVWQSNQKPFIEGGFSKLWTYLSVIDGQVGRFRGEMEKENQLVQACRAGRLDPRDVFPSLSQCTKAIDGALAMHNSDKVRSIYGEWIPEVRHRQLGEQRPWKQLAPDLHYLFAPIVREWTVIKGSVGTKSLALADGISAPFYFGHDDLWRMNGQKVKLYFDAAAPEVIATVVALNRHAGFAPGDIICEAKLMGDLPHYARAAMGWADPANPPATPSNRGALSALKREVRMLSPGGRIKAASAVERNGNGSLAQFERGLAQPTRAGTPRKPAPAPVIDEVEEIETLGISRNQFIEEEEI
ncbi:MAG: hypothetical protein ABS95_01200 [Verrucomicrobia bacterium SCN 57-15]|nr:MAG: hypothetical protein ABS95_01200 [Verrucomicrobia bacterium SCN 57-15]